MHTSVKTRFFASLFSNSLRAVLSFLTGLFIARGLSPSGYGELTFLLGSFVSVRTLLDMGTYNAFYTFISQEKRQMRYYTYYGLWLSLQFLLTLSIVGVLLPKKLLSVVWVGQDRPLVLLAFAASFFQQQIWLTVNQIGEAARKTVKVQFLNVSIAVFYFAAVAAMSSAGLLSVRSVLALMILQYAAGVLAAYRVLGLPETSDGAPGGQISAAGMFAQYRAYCSPLVLLSLFSFAYDFADKWLLQRFGGAAQQGFYQIAYQFAGISVLATASILNIFWKEMAESLKMSDTLRVERLFTRVSRGLYMFGAFLSAFIVPWSPSLVGLFLGPAYAGAGPVLALMLLYPVHQSLGQVAGTMLLAGERTRQHLAISSVFMLSSLPISYFLQAPPTAMIPGLKLGALGLAAKMVALNIISVNVTLWMVARNQGWKLDWVYQASGLAVLLAFGWASRQTAILLLGEPSLSLAGMLPRVLFSGAAYLAATAALIWRLPWLIGMDRPEIAGYAGRLAGFFRDRFPGRRIC